MSRHELKPDEVHAIVCALRLATEQYGKDIAGVRQAYESDARSMVRQVEATMTEAQRAENYRRVEAGEFMPAGIRRTIEQFDRQRATCERLADKLEEQRVQIVMGED